MLSNKVILTDCDGVLLDWNYGFHRWLNANRKFNLVNDSTYSISERYDIDSHTANFLVETFCNSAYIAKLSPFRDSIKYVRKLHEEYGFVFHAITSISGDPVVKELRQQNLDTLFGKGVFERLECLHHSISKEVILKEYRNTNCIWVEDHPGNADIGVSLGLNSYLIRHSYNSTYDGKAHVVDNWKDIYNSLL